MAQVSDGTSNVILCGEKYIDPYHYLDGSGCTVINCARFGGYRSGQRSVTAATATRTRPDRSRGGIRRATVRQWGSAHAGMCNMAFCDGSVHQISYGIARAIFGQLGNRADGNAIDASMY